MEILLAITIIFHYVLYTVPSEAISLTITGDQPKPALEGESFNITCCYTLHTTGLLSVPTLEWYRGPGKITSDVTTEYSVININQCSILNIINVNKVYEEDAYTCKGVLPSTLLQNGNLSVRTMLNISMADSEFGACIYASYVDWMCVFGTSIPLNNNYYIKPWI